MRRAVVVSLAAAITVAAVLVTVPVGSANAKRRAHSCASYPTPGSIAPARAKVPRALTAEYRILGRRPRRSDRLTRAQLGQSLTASGVIMSGIRYLGRAAFGGRVYLVPAEHQLAFKLAPARCIPAAERSLEVELRPKLEREYSHYALCLLVLNGTQGYPSCDQAPGTPAPLLYASGSPGFGLAPDGVSAVVVHYFTAPAVEVHVHHNFWIVNDAAQTAAPCGVDWVDSTGVVLRIVLSCSPTGDDD